MKYYLLCCCFLVSIYFPGTQSIIGDEYNIGILYHEDDSWNSEIALHTSVQYYNTNNNEKFKLARKFVSKVDHLSANNTFCELTAANNGIIGVIGPTVPHVANLVQSVCTKLELPHIQYHWRPDMYSENSKFVVNLYPDTTLLSKGLATLVRHMKWKGFIVLYENSDSLVRLGEILKLSGPIHNQVILRQLDTGNDFRPLLKEVKNFSDNPIILDCHVDRILPFFVNAKEINMLEIYHRYLITNLDAHTLDFSQLKYNANITTVRLFDPQSPLVQNTIEAMKKVKETNDHDRFAQKFVLNNSPNSYALAADKLRVETALILDAMYLFLESFVQLSKSSGVIRSRSLQCDGGESWKNGLDIPNFMRLRTVDDGVTGPIQFDINSGDRINFQLQAVEIHDEGLVQVAQWRPELGDDLEITRNETAHKEQVAQSLRKGKVIVISKLGMPHLREKKHKDGGDMNDDDHHPYEGFAMDIIKEIAKELNFTFEFKITSEYGRYDPKTNSWNGLMGELIEKRAHLAICDLTITHQRRSLVDFSLPFMNLGVSILHTKAKAKEDSNKFAFMEPFSFEVWVYTVTLYLIISCTLYFLCRIAPGDWENPHPCDPDPEELENIWNFKNCFWLMLGSIMTQGCDILPKGISSRMGASMWWFFSLILTSSYTANLAAFLTKERMGSSINSADDLAKQTKIKYGTVDGGATQAFFRNSNFSTYQRMWANMVQTRPSVFEKTNADGVRRVNNTKNAAYAFLMESSSIEYEMEKNCNLRQVGGLLDSRSYGIAMPMNSEYRSAIDNTLLKLQEGGVLSDLKKRWWKDKIEKEVACEETDDVAKSSDALALANVGGVFILLGVGISIAFFLALVEFLWNVRKVAVEEHISYWEALWVELSFAANVWVTQKMVKPDLSDSTSSEGSDTRSIAQRVIQGAGSILNLKSFR